MYDTIKAKCPDCGVESEFQSKSGPCTLSVFRLEDAPTRVLRDANRHSPNACGGCGTLFKIDTENRRGVPWTMP